MTDEEFKRNLRSWFHPSQVEPDGVRWDVNDGILPWEEIEEQYMWYRRIGHALQPKRLLEVGVGHGYSTLSMLSDVTRVPEVYWIDNESGWPGSINHACKSVFDEYGVYATWNPTWPVFERWVAQNHFDLIHVDAGHTYVDVFQDLIYSERYWDVRSHVLVHDTDDPPVSKAIEDFCSVRPHLSVFSLPVRCGLKVIHSCEANCLLNALL